MTTESYLCYDCPRSCGTPRGRGFCGGGVLVRVARAAPHFGEEPCISGSRGSGAVFFSGCNLRCIFCQNHEISRGGIGKELSVGELRDVLLRLRDQGVHNINLVTGSHYVRQIAKALSRLDLGVPVVWNSSGYDSVEALRQLDGLVQVYMPDLKYLSSPLAARFSAAPDYPEKAVAAIEEMVRQTGPFALDEDGMLIRGVLIRHLVLPGQLDNSFDVIDYVASHFPGDTVLFSLMSQFTPNEHCPPELRRTLTREEYSRCRSYLELSGIENGFFQELDAAGPEMIPDFDLTGVE
ncbi:MAG: radical SAM protein [Oscillospiraceae bacterium]|nr:radical SAM protein [Oscillospiraceae bacterium]